MSGKYVKSLKIVLLLVVTAAIAELAVECTDALMSRYRQWEASRIMKRSIEIIGSRRLALGVNIDEKLDPGRTGIIGEEFTELTTTLGHVEDKRTAASPDFAAMMVRYFDEAGLKRGDAVAIGSSGSFPGLALAVLSACRAMELDVLLIYSIGASMYGANLPKFTFLDMLKTLDVEGVLSCRPVAVSMGGNGDRAEDMFFPRSQEIIRSLAEASGLVFIHEKSVEESIRRRLELYEDAAGSRGIGCFVNIGGAVANFGDSEDSVAFPNGLVRSMPELPEGPRKGLIFEYLRRGIPVVHLLNVRGLAEANGIAYDPLSMSASLLEDEEK